ncbi:MAG TPA: hypothetical protein VIG24_04950 [Acidimicrobiia bacterium]
MEIHVYRIGGGQRYDWWAHRWHVDCWFRSWQAEWEGALWCPRSWTPGMVRRKARRWIARNTDLKKHEKKYGHNEYARQLRGLSPWPEWISVPDVVDTPTNSGGAAASDPADS